MLTRDLVVKIDRTTPMPLAAFLATAFDTPDGEDFVVADVRRVELHFDRRDPGPDGLTHTWVLNGTAD